MSPCPAAGYRGEQASGSRFHLPRLLIAFVELMVCRFVVGYMGAEIARQADLQP